MQQLETFTSAPCAKSAAASSQLEYEEYVIARRGSSAERDLFVDNLLVRTHFIIEMIRWTGLALWEFEFPFPGSLTSTILVNARLGR